MKRHIQLSTLLIAFALTACLSSPREEIKNSSSPDPGLGAQDKSCPVRSESGNHCFKITWIDPPHEGAGNSFVLEYLGGNFDDLPSLSVILFMDMGGGNGHGSSKVELSRKSTSEILVTKVKFTMPGKWQIQFFFEKDGKSTDQFVVKLEV